MSCCCRRLTCPSQVHNCAARSCFSERLHHRLPYGAGLSRICVVDFLDVWWPVSQLFVVPNFYDCRSAHSLDIVVQCADNRSTSASGFTRIHLGRVEQQARTCHAAIRWYDTRHALQYRFLVVSNFNSLISQETFRLILFSF